MVADEVSVDGSVAHSAIQYVTKGLIRAHLGAV
eukprot:CAMPEP_0169479476 /NCGR_PEP_ID=MMETSP1042-20121227/29042_1 /TAXON_ID=464988 /ORGANISM="Hemiselmis andersenii, Strain CCMP1180" /LENGTH=32 /DNA_ID= /DNA_START= /DNA_END= /DNA_ORIENTATION=